MNNIPKAAFKWIIPITLITGLVAQPVSAGDKHHKKYHDAATFDGYHEPNWRQDRHRKKYKRRHFHSHENSRRDVFHRNVYKRRDHRPRHHYQHQQRRYYDEGRRQHHYRHRNRNHHYYKHNRRPYGDHGFIQLRF